MHKFVIRRDDFAFLILILILIFLIMCPMPKTNVDLNGKSKDRAILSMESKQIQPGHLRELESIDMMDRQGSPEVAFPHINTYKPQHNSGTLSNQSYSDLGTELRNVNNWITVNHDVYGTRNSPQTIINKNNVAMLQLKWRLINDAEIQDPPIVIGDRGYVQDYAGAVIAFDTHTGEVIWKLQAGTGPTMGLAFNDGIIFASTAYNANVLAINATSGKVVWKSHVLGDSKAGYNIPTFPIVWRNYVIVGSAGHDDTSSGVVTVRGNITALSRY